MRRSKKLLASIMIVALLVTSGVHALADEHANVPTTEDQGVSDEGLGDSGIELGESDVELGDTEGSLCILDDDYGCCTSGYELELDLEDANIIEVDDEDLEDYERMDLLYIVHPILHAPEEQFIAVFFEEEEMMLTEATLHTRSLITGEEFSHPHYMIIENTVSFVIYHQEGSGEDEILLVSIEYLFEGKEEPVVLEFYDHNIETSYTVTNEPLPGSEESGIVVYGFGEDGEIIAEETDIYSISETIEEIIYIIDDEAVSDDSAEGIVAEVSPVGISPMSAGITPMSGGNTQITPTTGIAPFTNTNRIIVVSAGHCSTHAGASANGLVEHELNWHVAGVVVNELNTFSGITAIRDRPTIHCRWPGGGWQRCVTERVHQARRDGASMFVDIHFNASTNPAAHGAEIWIPNTSINDGMHQAGRLLSDEILRRLSALGMHNRGHRTVPDGQLEFASNRIARELGMVGILVEGGFLTNTADANRLRDPNFRHRLGVEIARGIAAVNLGNIGQPPPPPAPIVSTTTARDANGRETLFDLRTVFSSGGNQVSRVRFAVWGEVNGQNDLVWYEGTRNADGSWTTRADVRRHGETGRYQVHAWITTTAGANQFTSSTTFNVRAATRGSVQVVNSNPGAGTFDIVVSGTSCVSGITEVRKAVWSQDGQRDLAWYTGVRQSNGSFRATANLANHNFNLGNYFIHAWVTTGNGQRFAVGTRHNVTTRPQATVTATNRNGIEIFYDLRATNVAIFGNMQRVRFAVWSERNGQDDLIWYEGVRQANGSWTTAADIRRHGDAGRYQVHVWGIRTDGSGVFVGSTRFNVTPPSGGRAQVVNINQNAGTFDVAVSGINSVSGISEVRVAVWSQDGQRDLVWYTGVRQPNGSFRVAVNLANHNFNLGNYFIHAWITTGNGQRFAVGTRHNVTIRPQATVTATRRAGSEVLFDLRATNVAIFGNMQQVRFAVWSERSGQNGLIWYEGIRGANGSWTATADTRRHNGATGRYHVHVWGIRTDGSGVFIGGTTFNATASGGTTPGLISIMGPSGTNAAQMVRNYRNSGHTFPSGALGMSLENFAQLVLTEANREGVRAEVLWAQVMRETGWLQFGGCVRINQFNFGGLGATGGGNPGHSFPSVQIGLRAQVHHLVAYATTAPVRNPSNRAHPVMRTSPPWGPTGQTVVNGTESPRFHFVTRGISPYVNWLGQGENPNHPGLFWAADRNYGAALAAAIRVLLNS